MYVILSAHVILSEAKDLSAIRILRRYAPQNDKKKRKCSLHIWKAALILFRVLWNPV